MTVTGQLSGIKQFYEIKLKQMLLSCFVISVGKCLGKNWKNKNLGEWEAETIKCRNW